MALEPNLHAWNAPLSTASLLGGQCGGNDSVPVKLAESAAYTRASARLQPGRSKRMRVVAGGNAHSRYTRQEIPRRTVCSPSTDVTAITRSHATPICGGGGRGTLYLSHPQDFNLCEQRNTLVFSGTPNLACKAKMRRSTALGKGWAYMSSRLRSSDPSCLRLYDRNPLIFETVSRSMSCTSPKKIRGRTQAIKIGRWVEQAVAASSD